MKKIMAIGVSLLVVILLLNYGERTVVSSEVIRLSDLTRQQQPLRVQSAQDIAYKNEKQNFSLTFPKTWDGYNTIEQTNDDVDTVCFSFKQPQSFCIFTIIKYTYGQWAQVKSKQVENIIVKTDNSIFICDGCCKQGDDMTGAGQFNDFQTNRCGEVPEIIKTFTVLKSQIVDQTKRG